MLRNQKQLVEYIHVANPLTLHPKLYCKYLNYSNIDLSCYMQPENELISGATWRKTRTEEPCTSCLYQFLYPDLSAYK